MPPPPPSRHEKYGKDKDKGPAEERGRGRTGGRSGSPRGPRTHPGGMGGVAAPMSGLRHRIPAALQPGGGTCGRAGEIPGIAGIAAPAAAPSPPPCPPRHEHSGPHPRAPTAGLSPPHSTALLRAPSALRCPARPPHASPGADVPRPHLRQPRGGGRLSGPGVAAVSPGPVCSPPHPSAPRSAIPESPCQHPRVKLGHGDVGRTSLSLPLPLPRAPRAVPGVSRGPAPSPLLPRTAQRVPTGRAGLQLSCPAVGGGGFVIQPPAGTR